MFVGQKGFQGQADVQVVCNDASTISVAQIFLYLQLKYFFVYSSNISQFPSQIFLNFKLKYEQHRKSPMEQMSISFFLRWGVGVRPFTHHYQGRIDFNTVNANP